jgi:competence protein ComEA
MPTADERRAFAFLVALALLAAGVRVMGVRRFGGGVPVEAATLGDRALAAQIEAVDSARRNPRVTRSRRATPTAPRQASSRSAAPRAARQGASSGGRRPPTVSGDVAPPPLNVNAATAQELERLPRVGPALARRIVEWRERHGPFVSLEDLRHVRGIGPSTVRLLDSLVTFSGRHRPFDSEGHHQAPDILASVY